jgi:Rab proteins geranylgeranyltransferase component A
MLIELGDISELFLNASITKPTNDEGNTGGFEKLSFSRAYTLALSPQIIYSRSKLLTQLVTSKVYRQLEFQAVGNWWIYYAATGTSTAGSEPARGLKRIPNGREDIFSDESIDVRAKRNLMKFLKFVVDYENHTEVWQSHAEEPLTTFLSTVFNLPTSLRTTIVALTLSLKLPSQTTVRYSLPRIARHMTSMGVFGPGFAAVIPKWGGSSEIAQVACRAGAVGGGVYILGTGIKESSSAGASRAEVTLSNNEVIKTKALIKSQDSDSEFKGLRLNNVSKMIAAVSSDLSSLFTSTVEGGPIAAVSVIAFPSNSIKVDDNLESGPVYIMAHSSDTGECPVGQCEYESLSSLSSIHDESLIEYLSTLSESIEENIPLTV